ENTRKFDLTEAGVIGGDGGGGGGFRRGFGEVDFGGRAAGVADNKRARAITGSAELRVVGVRPVVGDVDIVGDEIFPEVDVSVVVVFTEDGDGCRKERETGRGRCRVFDDEQAAVLRVGEVDQAFGER